MSEAEESEQEGTASDPPTSPAQANVGLQEEVGTAEEDDGEKNPDQDGPRDLTAEEHVHNRTILEALLMASDAPLQVGRLLPALDGAGARDVRGYVDRLNDDYAREGRAFRIVEVAGGFQFAVERRYAPFVRRLLRDRIPVRLSQAALETLAVIAFKQPIAKAEVEAVRGVGADWVIRTLLEHNLIRIAGRSEGVGRPLLYGTTREFLRHFGLRTTADLPRLKEMDELLKEGERHVAQRTSEPVSGAGGGGVPEEERPADPGGPGDGERGGGRGPGDGDRP